MYKLVTMILLVFGCLSFVQAQDDFHKFEVYGGYSRDISRNPNFHINGAFNEREAGNNADKAYNGFNASATFNFSKYLGFKVDIADHFSTGTIQAGAITGNAGGITKKSCLNIQGGIQIKNNSKEARFKPFGQILAGINRQTAKIDNPNQFTTDLYGSDKITSSGFSTTFGGGLDIHLGKRIDVRAIQFNYTVNSIQNKKLTKQSLITQSPSLFPLSIAGGKQSQITFGFGVVFH